MLKRHSKSPGRRRDVARKFWARVIPVRANLRKPCVHSRRYRFDLILMNICQNICHHENRTDLKVGPVGSETRSLSQLLEKSCVLFSRHSFDPMCKKISENVWHHEMLDEIETGSSLVEK